MIVSFIKNTIECNSVEFYDGANGDSIRSIHFWKDDTHWNANGIAVAARVLCQKIKELNCVNNPLPAK